MSTLVPTKFGVPVPDLHRLRQLAGPVTPYSPAAALRPRSIRTRLEGLGYTVPPAVTW